MATKKEKNYAVYTFKTKEEFDKHFRSIYYSGYEHGFKDGRINALGYILDGIDEDFTAEEESLAIYQAKERKLRAWKKEEAARRIAEEKEYKEIIKEAAKAVEEL